jgi:hypothetical protein
MMNTLTNSNQATIPTIIGVAESTHYLVGAVDSLRDNNIFNAALEYQTAYDEMCGTSSSSGRCSQMIKF